MFKPIINIDHKKLYIINIIINIILMINTVPPLPHTTIIHIPCVRYSHMKNSQISRFWCHKIIFLSSNIMCKVYKLTLHNNSKIWLIINLKFKIRFLLYFICNVMNFCCRIPEQFGLHWSLPFSDKTKNDTRMTLQKNYNTENNS